MSRADAGLRGELRSYLGHIGQWVSLETGATEQGVPDCNVFIMRQAAVPGRDVWIECKATRGWSVRFKPMQVGWLFTRWRLGGNAFVATRRINVTRAGEVDELYVTSAQHVRELSVSSLQCVPHLLVAAGGPGQWPWVKIEHVLRHMR